ncbi:hypothetical protein Gotri_022227 [Gossypium trilobum]|uniref:Uncharacterized protein n=1 Tax=Gossypium trilobum TaxID=34281 RepID=A0A7J9DF96_9ROSI|nr:hypothetical protein [Gossypium trilobum]
MNITGISSNGSWPKLRKKGIVNTSLESLWDLILVHLDAKKRVDVFALSIFGLIIFPKALGHVDDGVSYLFDRLNKRVMPVLVILVETFISLSAS